jgi:Adenine specific DNA methylase Mod
MANINETINEISKINPELAKQVQKYVKSHSYGLVYEQNLPDAVRLWTKAPVKGDSVNILPPRGKEETLDNNVVWTVKDIMLGTASLSNGEETKEVAVEDIVPVAGYKDVIYPGMKVIDKIERGNPDDSYHMVINAENYHALEALCYAYAGKVDCIYIDPPYNTGAKDWKYNNNYVDGTDQYRHSKWLTFMERRLKLAKKLLNPDEGVLVVAIDDYEQARLSVLLDQLFPEYDLNTVIVNHHPQGGAADNISRTHEYAIFMTPKGKKIIKGQSSEDFDEEWSLMRGGTDKRNLRIGRPNSFYAIYVDKNTLTVKGVGPHLDVDSTYDSSQTVDNYVSLYPVGKDGKERVWRYERQSMEEHIKNGDIICSNQMTLKVVKHRDIKYEQVFSLWTDSRYNAGTNGTSVIANIFGSSGRFSYPKSLYTVEDAIKYSTAENKNALVVDFFAGSGTTLHATALLNAEDGGHRRCICVTNNEVSADEAKAFTKHHLRHCDPEWEKHGIANYVTWPRTVCSIKGEDVNGQPLKGNYIGSDISMADGLKANAIFCELTYESLWGIRLDRAFNAIAPILWMLAGCKGPIIEKRSKGYATTDNYAVLFNYAAVSKFVEAVKNKPSIEHVFVVTDDQKRYSNVVKRLPMIQPENIHRLYETYLKTYEIVGEGGLD